MLKSRIHFIQNMAIGLVMAIALLFSGVAQAPSKSYTSVWAQPVSDQTAISLQMKCNCVAADCCQQLRLVI
ncbi:MAG: hypothetical protein LBU61_05525 [Coriobacteriales bacterium]|jgi:hypothetical protein|nr:hypothetical protein [Coriobacteriales bacterium]